MFLAMLSMFLFACSDNDNPAPSSENAETGVTFEISAVNELKDGGTSRGSIYSQEATQHVTRVVVYAILNNGSDYVYSKSFTISGWSDGTTFMRYSIGNSEKLSAGDYKFLAIGRDQTDLFNISSPETAHNFDNMMATIAQSGDESEIFAGWSQANVSNNGGTRVSISMTRKVAGVLGYFKNIPQNINGTDVKYLRLSVSDANKEVNITNGAAITSNVTPYNIINIDLSGQTITGGVYAGNDLSGHGVVKLPNSQLSGSFFMPVSNVTMTLGLYDAGNNPLKTWVVKDTDGNSSFNILANHFYALGTKTQAGNTNGGTPEMGDDDSPIDLLTDQAIVISINPAWEVIHNMVIQ